MENQKCKNICKKAFDYLKQHTSIIVWVIILVAFALYFSLLYQKGNQNQSNNIVDFNGFFLPILTAINIFVFIRLTNTIDQNNEKNHEKEIAIQKKLNLYNIRNQNIKELNEDIIELRNKLQEDNVNLRQQLNKVRRKLISNFETSIYFTSKGLQQVINIESDFQNGISNLLGCIDNNITITEAQKKELFFKTFTIMNILESYALVQLHSEEVDPSILYLKEINDKIIEEK